ARRAGVPASTARTHLARALEELRARLSRERGDSWGLLVALAHEGGLPGASGAVAVADTIGKVTLMGMSLKVGGAARAGALVCFAGPRRASSPERTLIQHAPQEALEPLERTASAPSDPNGVELRAPLAPARSSAELARAPEAAQDSPLAPAGDSEQ